MQSISLFGFFVAFDEETDDKDDYMRLKTSFEKELKDAIQLIKAYDHKGFDVGIMICRSNEAILSCCIDEQSLWIGLYRKKEKIIQRHVIFDDVKNITDDDIKRFANIIENIAQNPKRMLDARDITKAWQEELNIINKEEGKHC